MRKHDECRARDFLHALGISIILIPKTNKQTNWCLVSRTHPGDHAEDGVRLLEEGEGVEGSSGPARSVRRALHLPRDRDGLGKRKKKKEKKKRMIALSLALTLT